MKFDSRKEKELLEFLEVEDHGDGVCFSEKEENLKKKWRDNARDQIIENPELTPSVRYHLKKWSKWALFNFSKKLTFELWCRLRLTDMPALAK